MPTNLTPAQLAEGARLLEASKDASADYLGDIDACKKWLYEHMPSLLSAAQRVAEVEGCVREIVNKLNEIGERYYMAAQVEPDASAEKLRQAAKAAACARCAVEVREIAKEHNIDLSEPGATSKTTDNERSAT